jgi:hypothetical protein
MKDSFRKFILIKEKCHLIERNEEFIPFSAKVDTLNETQRCRSNITLNKIQFQFQTSSTLNSYE